jgi:hypothetical protein
MSHDKGQKSGGKPTSVTEFADDPLKDKIGSSLRKMYDEVVNEPIPADFLNLLAKADTNKSESGNESA